MPATERARLAAHGIVLNGCPRHFWPHEVHMLADWLTSLRGIELPLGAMPSLLLIRALLRCGAHDADMVRTLRRTRPLCRSPATVDYKQRLLGVLIHARHMCMRRALHWDVCLGARDASPELAIGLHARRGRRKLLPLEMLTALEQHARLLWRPRSDDGLAYPCVVIESCPLLAMRAVEARLAWTAGRALELLVQLFSRCGQPCDLPVFAILSFGPYWKIFYTFRALHRTNLVELPWVFDETYEFDLFYLQLVFTRMASWLEQVYAPRIAELVLRLHFAEHPPGAELPPRAT